VAEGLSQAVAVYNVVQLVPSPARATSHLTAVTGLDAPGYAKLSPHVAGS